MNFDHTFPQNFVPCTKWIFSGTQLGLYSEGDFFVGALTCFGEAGRYAVNEADETGVSPGSSN